MTPEEFERMLAKLGPEMSASLTQHIRAVERGTASASQIEAANKRAANNIESSNRTLKSAYNGLVGYLQRTAKEQQAPLEVGIDAIQTVLNGTKSAFEGIKGPASNFGDYLTQAGKGINFDDIKRGLSNLGSAVTTVASDGFTILAEQLKINYEEFKKVSQSNIILGDGITGLAKSAAESGLPLKQFTRGLQLARRDLSEMGMGAGQATERVASVMGRLQRGSEEYSQSLSALGYSSEEQVALIAQQMANDRAAGVTKKKSDAELARDTFELGKNMKILSDITGKDAKAAMEQARIQSMEADLLAKAEAEGGAEGRAKLAAQLSTMPEEMKKGYLEFVSTGGQAIADAATNVSIQQNPKLMEFYQQQFGILSQGNVNAKAAQQLALDGLEGVAKAARENVGASAQIAMGARLTGDALLQGSTSISNALIRMGQQFGEGTVAATKASADKLAARTDELTKATEEIAKLGTAVQRETQNVLFAPLKMFGEGVESATRIITVFAEKIRNVTPGALQSPALMVAPGPTLPPLPGGTRAPTGRDEVTGTPNLPPTPPPSSRAPTGRNTVTGTPNLPPPPTARALGGEVLPNKTYLVGERGPELLAAREMGTVINNDNAKLMTAFKELSAALVAKKMEDPEASQIPKSDDKHFQTEMLTVLREQIILMRNNLNISSQMLESMDDIYSVQTRIANSKT